MSEIQVATPSPSPQPPLPQRESLRALINVPNTLCAIRLAGSFVLLYFVWMEQTTAFLWLFGFLLMTDWVDGKLAILLKQQTNFGARLDSVADAALYTALLIGTCWLEWEFVQREAVWLAAAVGTYVLSFVIALIKFRHMPSYHTRAAKTCWLLISLAAIAVFADLWAWFPRIALIAIMLTNIEAILITLVLPRRATNVKSLYHAIRDHRGPAPSD